ncbi:hypothetical protein [Bradyrhizobium liaoningense]|uniref:hypothetical protein n=1 Tax=Bradyrhizobium liaoningense TaxID=43992 RepID=UPI001BA74FB9|nr:hypothetical protein [Bradyrhizobium liaoningense]MBR1033044.1 hypothetical protein [Bradyrhizobium liaoningense]
MDPSTASLFPPGLHSSAAVLGPKITERAIKLEVLKARAEDYIRRAADYIDGGELDDAIISFLALLSLRARYLSDLTAEKAGIAARFPKEEMERLLKEALRHQHLVDSGSESDWY